MTFDRSSFENALLSPHAYDELERLKSTGAFMIFPEIEALVGFGGGDSGHKDLWDHTKKVVSQSLQTPVLRWAALFHDVGKPRCFRRDAKGAIAFHGHEAMSAKMFKKAAAKVGFFTQEETRYIGLLIYDLGKVEEYDATWSDSAVRRLLRGTKDHFNDLVSLARADISTQNAAKRQQHHRRMKELKDRAWELDRIDAIPPALPTGLGTAITQELGIPPSAALGDLMKTLKDEVEAGRLRRQADISEVLQYVKDRGLV